ncbi:MAG: TlpA disulfide reductase family protein [candidate division WOR-3 bacterium]
MIRLLPIFISLLINQKTVSSINFGVVDLDTIWGRKPVYISFWAIWCSNCVKELDRINKVKDSLGIFVVAVNEDGLRKSSNVLNFVRNRRWNFPVIIDDGQSLMKAFGISALPTSFLYSVDRKLLKKFTGFSEGDLKVIKELLGEEKQ